MSRRAHNLLRLFLSGMAALFAYTVVITSQPVTAAAAPDRAAPPRRPEITVDTGRAQIRPLPALPDPRLRFPR